MKYRFHATRHWVSAFALAVLLTTACSNTSSQEGVDTASAATAGVPGVGSTTPKRETVIPTQPPLSGTFPTAPGLEPIPANQVPPNSTPDISLCGDSIRLTGAHFETGKWELVPEADATIEAALYELREQTSDWVIIIYGHTDSRPFSALPGGNSELSQLRAQAVAGKLIELGLDPNRLRLPPIGLGAEMLLDAGDDDEAHAENRRVEIVQYCVNARSTAS